MTKWVPTIGALLFIGLFAAGAESAIWSAPTVTTAGALCLSAIVVGVVTFAFYGVVDVFMDA